MAENELLKKLEDSDYELCPFCASPEIHSLYKNDAFDFETYSIDVHCDNCGKTWREHMKVTNVEELPEEKAKTAN